MILENFIREEIRAAKELGVRGLENESVIDAISDRLRAKWSLELTDNVSLSEEKSLTRDIVAIIQGMQG